MRRESHRRWKVCAYTTRPSIDYIKAAFSSPRMYRSLAPVPILSFLLPLSFPFSTSPLRNPRSTRSPLKQHFHGAHLMSRRLVTDICSRQWLALRSDVEEHLDGHITIQCVDQHGQRAYRSIYSLYLKEDVLRLRIFLSGRSNLPERWRSDHFYHSLL